MLFRITGLLFCLFFGQVLFGQTYYCDKAHISQTDKQLIEQFWVDFKTAINTKDKVRLSSLIQFSFTCDYCIADTSKDKNDAYLRVTKALFNSAQYKIFFDPKLVKTANKSTSLFSILFITKNDTSKLCDLNFGYASVEPSKQWEGQQHFFTIEKINDKFLITSAWTVP